MTSTDFIAADELRTLRQRVVHERMKYLVNLGTTIRHTVSAVIRGAGPFARPKTAAH
jgi:hypothetical protein